MERIEDDPEIDPSIREEREAQMRERELVGRIRLEIERYVEENDLVPRASLTPDPATQPDPESATATATPSGPASAMESEPESAPAPKKPRTKAVSGVLTGTILTGEWMRRSWPYLAGFAVVLVLYISHTFQLQKLHLERQQLETEVRELGVEAVRRTAERVSETRRSAIVERLRQHDIPLQEFSHPVKTIKR
jgi:hypothetical protein